MIQLVTTIAGLVYAAHSNYLNKRVSKLEKEILKMPTKADVLTAVSDLSNSIVTQLDKIEADLAAYQESVNNGTQNSQDLQEILNSVTEAKTRIAGAADEIDANLPERTGTDPNPNPDPNAPTV